MPAQNKDSYPLTQKGVGCQTDYDFALIRRAAGTFYPVAAPAGFGKTTLVLSGITVCGMPAGWFSLDKGDNRVEQFWR